VKAGVAPADVAWLVCNGDEDRLELVKLLRTRLPLEILVNATVLESLTLVVDTLDTGLDLNVEILHLLYLSCASSPSIVAALGLFYFFVFLLAFLVLVCIGVTNYVKNR